jgi:hypothetical protein
MNVAKGLGTGILSFLLFISLSVFGLAFLLHSTLLNPNFVASEVDKLNFTAVTQEFVDKEFKDKLPTEAAFLKEAVYDVVAQEQTWIKQQADYAIHTSYDYLLGNTDELVINIPLEAEKANLKERLWDALNKELPGWLPEIVGQELGPYIDEHIQDYVNIVPRQLLPFGDMFSTEQLSQYLHEYLQQVDTQIITGNIPLVTGLLEALIRPYYDQYYDEFAAQVPDNEIYNQENIPADTMDALVTARHYIGVFQTWYYVLIAIMALLVAGIILINRNVRVITRSLGIGLAVYGIFEFAGVLVARAINFTGILSDLSASLDTWITGFFRDFLLPLQLFSLGVLVIGVVLLVVSFVYRPRAADVGDGS